MIQLPQRVTALLPEGVGVKVGLIAHGGAFHLAHLGRIHRVVADGDRKIVVGEPALRRQSRLAAAAGGGDALAPFGIGHVAGGEHTLEACFGAAGAGHQIAVAVHLQLITHQPGVGGVADGIEEAAHRQLLAGASGGIHQLDRLQPVVAAAVADLTVPVHGDVGVGQHPIGHRLAGAQLVGAHDQVHAAAVFGEVDGLFAGGVAAAHHRQLLVAELGRGAVADRAGADARIPEALFAGQAQAVGAGTGGQDHGLGLERLAIGLDAERPLGEIDRLGIGLHQAGAPAHGLGLEPVHQVRAEDAIREAGEILHVGGGHQLTTGDAAVLKARDQQRAQVGAGGIDRSGVAGWAGADDHQIFNPLPDPVACTCLPGPHGLCEVTSG